MKKQKLQKLTLKKEAVSKLQSITGGAPNTYKCTIIPVPVSYLIPCPTQIPTQCANQCTSQIFACPNTKAVC